MTTDTSQQKNPLFVRFNMGINLDAPMSPLLCGYMGETYRRHLRQRVQPNRHRSVHLQRHCVRSLTIAHKVDVRGRPGRIAGIAPADRRLLTRMLLFTAVGDVLDRSGPRAPAFWAVAQPGAALPPPGSAPPSPPQSEDWRRPHRSTDGQSTLQCHPR
jgi:hypothetical protein